MPLISFIVIAQVCNVVGCFWTTLGPVTSSQQACNAAVMRLEARSDGTYRRFDCMFVYNEEAGAKE